MLPHDRARAFLEGVEATDDIQEALDELVGDTMHADASRLANAEADDARDEELHGLADVSASSINNLGPEGQIAWLIRQGFSEDDLRHRVFDTNPDDQNPGM